MKSAFCLLLFALAAASAFAASTAPTTPSDSLIRAATKGDVAGVEEILHAGGDVNARNALTGWTPLIGAAYYGHPQVVEVLIKAGANVNLQDYQHSTALMKAVTLGSFDDFEAIVRRKSEVLKLLLKAGADPQARDRFGVAAWQMPFDDDLPPFVRIFEEAGVKGVLEEELLQAVNAGDLQKARTFLEKGADVNFQTRDGDCWSQALAWGNPDMIDLLFQHGGSLDHRMENEITPLMVAAAIGSEKLVQEFLTAGADVTVKNSDGQTALDLALKSGNAAIAQILRQAMDRKR